MKKHILFLAFIISFQVSICNAQLWKVENNFENNVIIVIGTATSEIPADKASFSFGVNGYSQDLNSAVEFAREKVDVITKRLLEIGITNQNLTTSKFNSQENRGDKAFLSSKRDYIASLKVIVNLDSIELLEPAITTVSVLKADYISDVTFSLTNIELFKTRTITSATQNALYKAKSICDNLNIKLGPPVYIEEINDNSTQVRRDFTSSIRAMESVVIEKSITNISSIFIENIKIDASVRVIFMINS
jgi:uncharacterized protein YggE